MMRRPFLITLLGSSWAMQALAVQRKSLADPMHLGVEQSLVDSGLAGKLQRSFGRDTGVAVLLVPGASATVLAALEQGEVDAALTDAPEIEMRLEKQGLAHDRRQVAMGDMVLVGPVTGKGRKLVDPAGVAGERDIATALVKLSQAQARVVSAPDGSGAYLAELALWRAAKVGPAAPWYAKTPEKEDALALAATQGAYTLVDRGRWLARGRKPLAVLVEGDARMGLPVHVMRSFRVNHPAAKLFVQWVSGPQGHQVAGSVAGWRGAVR